MPKPGFSFKLAQNPEFKKQLELIRSWPNRMRHIEAQMAYMGADFLKRYVQSKLPASGPTKLYRQSLEVVQVKGTAPGEYAFGVQADQTHGGVRKLNVQRELLFVRATERTLPSTRAVKILERYNPWTIDTLPFKPDPAAATIERVRTTPQQVKNAARLRTRQQLRWGPQLVRTGIRPTWKSHQTPRIDPNNPALADVALDALKMEFGMGDAKPQPHWRLGVLALKRQGFAAFAKDPRFLINPLTKSSSSEWRRWPPRTKHSISIEKAKSFGGFARKIAGG